MNKTFVTQPFLPPLEEFMPYLEKIWQEKRVTNNGIFHQQLEAELAGYLGVSKMSLFTNGTIALITALQALRITGEVITTPYTFVATAHSLIWNKNKPVFVYIENFNKQPSIRILPERPEHKENHSYFPILIESEYPITRDQLYNKLREHDIYPPLFLTAHQ